MRLSELDPSWVCYDKRPDAVYHTHVETLSEAHGIKFLCPKCFVANNGPVGTHAVICWFEDKVPEDASPGPGRWNPMGTNFEDLSFVPGKKTHSILLIDGCAWHGFITNGEVVDA